MLKQQQGGMLGGWLGRVTGSYSESDEEGTARRGGTTSAPGATPRGWGSGIVTALSGRCTDPVLVLLKLMSLSILIWWAMSSSCAA